MRGAEPDQKDCCHEIPDDSCRNADCDRDRGKRVVETGVRGERDAVAPLGIAVYGEGESDQGHPQRNAESARQVAEAKREGRDDQQGGGDDLEGRVDLDRYRS